MVLVALVLSYGFSCLGFKNSYLWFDISKISIFNKFKPKTVVNKLEFIQTVCNLRTCFIDVQKGDRLAYVQMLVKIMDCLPKQEGKFCQESSLFGLFLVFVPFCSFISN